MKSEMEKFECSTPLCQRKVPCVLISDDESAYTPVRCPHTGTYTGWRIIEESKEEEVKLPKLTAEVFDRPDCPKGALWATVDNDGTAYFHLFTPILYTNEWQKTNYCQKIPGKWDATNWTEIIKRLPKDELPDWCKVEEWLYYPEDMGHGVYLKISEIKNGVVYAKERDDYDPWQISYKHIREYAKPAHKRPFNEKEMKALLGKVIVDGENEFFVSAYYGEIKILAAGVSGEFDAQSLMRCICEGKPCFKLEHLNEKGEWVE